MESHNLRELSAFLPLLEVSKDTTEEEAMASVRTFSQFEDCFVGVTHFSGLTPWERHNRDEFLYVLEGKVEVTILEEGVERKVVVHSGEVCVVPKMLWHRQLPNPNVKLMFITGETEVSYESIPDSSKSN